MWRILFICLAPLWAGVVHAEPIVVPRALFSVELPEPQYWKVLSASEFPDAAGSMCFPRFRRGGVSISAGLWEYPYTTLEAHIDAYFVRMNRHASGSYTRELKREKFYTRSGVTVIRLLVETGKNNGNHWQLVRYIFRNRDNMVICVSASGSPDLTDQVMRSMELLPPPK